MSYYFAIIGTQDNPLFEYEFGTSKQGGDGQARFSEQARHLNQFILHSSLDIVEELQWSSSQLYLKCVDKFFNSYISCFVTGSNVKFLLLHQPLSSAMSSATATAGGLLASATGAGGGGAGGGAGQTSSSTRSSTSIPANPTSQQTEEAVRNFFNEVFENYVKTIMSPFYRTNAEIKSPLFRDRVRHAGKKYL